MKTLPVGLECVGDLTEKSDGSVRLIVKRQHSMAKSIEPGLEEILRISVNKTKTPRREARVGYMD